MIVGHNEMNTLCRIAAFNGMHLGEFPNEKQAWKLEEKGLIEATSRTFNGRFYEPKFSLTELGRKVVDNA